MNELVCVFAFKRSKKNVKGLGEPKEFKDVSVGSGQSMLTSDLEVDEMKVL
jgi:hypothetical protein